MNICTEYKQCKDIIACASDIVIGTIDDVSADVYVWLIDTATGKRLSYPVTSDINGLVTLDASGIPLMNGRSYQVFTTGQNDLNTMLLINLDDDIFNVLQFRCYYSNIFPQTQTLAIDD